jgi:Flp pilus assembly protein TadG
MQVKTMSILRNKASRSVKTRNRRGVASVEFAMVLPALLVLTLGTLDLCSMMFLKETVVLAAYEGARAGVNRGNTDADAVERVTEFLDERGVVHHGAGSVAISGASFDSADTLQHVTITVTVPAAGNLIIPSAMFAGLNVSASVTMRKEFQNLN